jgi:Protein of unknown function (DUF1353)
MPFEPNSVVVVREDDRDPVFWETVEPLCYHGKNESFTVPAGFKTDFASVPRPLVWLLPRYGAYTRSAILHDYLCKEKPVDRADADGIFRRSMRELKVPFVRRWIMWAAVRLNSHLSNAAAAQIAIWFLVALPALAFVIAPALMILIWLLLFSLIEFIFYGLLKPFSKKPVNPPRVAVKTTD